MPEGGRRDGQRENCGNGADQLAHCNSFPGGLDTCTELLRPSGRHGFRGGGRPAGARRHLSSQAQSTSEPSTRKATRTWARHSSRFSPLRPVETTSTARMLRSEVCACLSACCAASSEDFLELPTSSMIFTTATGPPL